MVFFATLIGFTEWSASRSPKQILCLLEAAFHVMDRLAKLNGIFKVEAHVEMYFAVTGLPEKQLDHAVRMARFAKQCMRVVSQLLHDKSVVYGDDTKNLRLQAGIHSGGVTAGIMGGHLMSRYQVFGDSANCASILMSTGATGEVQVG